MSEEKLGPLYPQDEHNQKLASNVHPEDWKNPTPDGKYNLVVIGAGTAGLVASSIAAGMGGKVALIERELMGGDCLNVGCVPSKGIIAAAHAAAAVKEADKFGVNVPHGVTVDFGKAMERMRKLRADISPHDSVERFSNMGMDVFLGQAKFTSGTTVEVGGQELEFSKAVICTGARASAPPIPGLENVEYLTNETFFSLTELPKRLGVIGAGPIGCEMAQSFARFGSEVTVFETQSGVLPKEDRDAGKVIREAMEKDGVTFMLPTEGMQLHRTEGAGVRIEVKIKGEEKSVEVDRLLVAVGRAPNVEGLGLEEAGVEFDKKGVKVDGKLRTSNKRIFAAGDICSPFQFTHAADFMARNVIRNALFFGRAKTSSLVIPWCTYTAPEVAHVGTPASQIKEDEVDTFKLEMDKVDRALLEGDTEGYVKIHVKKGSDKIVAASVVAKNAGDIISQISQAMTHGIGLGGIGSVISPYPTQGEAVRKVGDLYGRTKLTPFAAKILKKLLEWQR